MDNPTYRELFREVVMRMLDAKLKNQHSTDTDKIVTSAKVVAATIWKEMQTLPDAPSNDHLNESKD